MAFGQSAGPPASARRVRELLELVQAAGHADFRDARGPMGFTQRQAAGKFTREEADAYIAQLQSQLDDLPEAERVNAAPTPRETSAERAARALPSDVLAAELQRRGWIVVEP